MKVDPNRMPGPLGTGLRTREHGRDRIAPIALILITAGIVIASIVVEAVRG